MRAEERIAFLSEKLHQALEQLSQTQEQLRLTQEQLSETQKQLGVAQARIEELEKLKTPPPAFVKAKKKKPPQEQKKAHKKREARHNQARRRSRPTEIVEHRLLTCPECHLRLGGISLARSREVIDVPAPPASRGDGTSDLQGLVCRVSKMAGSKSGFPRTGGRPRTHRRATGQFDCHVAHGDASAQVVTVFWQVPFLRQDPAATLGQI